MGGMLADPRCTILAMFVTDEDNVTCLWRGGGGGREEYELILPVYPLGTILAMFVTDEDNDTCLKPISHAISPTSFSCSS